MESKISKTNINMLIDVLLINRIKTYKCKINIDYNNGYLIYFLILFLNWIMIVLGLWNTGVDICEMSLRIKLIFKIKIWKTIHFIVS